MNFQTQIPISKSQNPIDYNSQIMSLGSCFAENMAEKFEYFKFRNFVNPFGIIFNAVSIERIVKRVVNQELFTEKDIFFHNEHWHCFEVHSDLSHENKEVFLENLNQILKSTNQQIINSTHFIITYGTSWVYRLRQAHSDKQGIVANCHKMPQKHFSKEILSIETTQKSIENTILLIQSINKNAQFIFTVSPVRHIKDGFVENNVSKAHLISSIYNNVTLSLSKCYYFPSYEIMMDELRDYRFYKQDMLHPNSVAIDYVWERFFMTQILEEIHPVMQEVCNIQKSLLHKPFNPNSENHKVFLSKIQDKITKLQERFPTILY